MNRRLLVIPCVCVLALVGPAPAVQADIVFNGDPLNLARAAFEAPATVTTAQTLPAGKHNLPLRAVSTTPLGQFPVHGDSYIILSTGDVQLADDANSSATSGVDHHYNAPHPDPQGSTASYPADPGTIFDLSALQFGFTAPAGTECLKFQFQFLTDELPEAVDSLATAGPFGNDGFLARVYSSINSESNIAFDSAGGRVQAWNAIPEESGPAAYAPENAAGTTYDAATPLLTATAAMSPGANTINFSLFDHTDGTVDSAVFIDRISFGPAPGCRASLGGDIQPPSAPPAINARARYGLAVTNPTSVAVPFGSLKVDLPAGASYVSGSTTGATSANPTPITSGGDLLWTPGGTIGPGATSIVRFTMKAPPTARSHPMTMRATAGDHSVLRTENVIVAKAATAITAGVSKGAERVQVTGKVSPARPSKPVTVTLYRKVDGEYQKRATKSPNLSGTSTYAATFDRLPAGGCKAVSRYAGDANHKASAVTAFFTC